MRGGWIVVWRVGVGRAHKCDVVCLSVGEVKCVRWRPSWGTCLIIGVGQGREAKCGDILYTHKGTTEKPTERTRKT